MLVAPESRTAPMPGLHQVARACGPGMVLTAVLARNDLAEAPGTRKVAFTDAGWSSSVARWAHNPEVVGSNPTPATRQNALGT
jgi:hypothetical protein